MPKFYLPLLFRIAAIFALCTPGYAAGAQQLQPPPWNDPAVSWKTPAQAQTSLQGELQTIQPQLADLIPGTPSHTDLLRRILYFKSILRNLQSGSTVQLALDAGLPEAASLGGLYEQQFTPETTLRALYEDALGLVTN